MPDSHRRYNKFLVIQTASIGDVILATPVIEKLHRFFPDARIDIVVKKGNEKLFDHHQFLNQVFVWDKSGSKYRNLLKLITEIRSVKYDCVINIQRFASSGIITALSGAEMKTGFDKNPFSFLFTRTIKHEIGSNAKHETERNLELIEFLTDSSRCLPRLYPSESDYNAAAQYKTKPYITISPASLWFTKQFPEERWSEFLNKLKRELTVVFLGAPSDTELCSRIISQTGHKNCINLAGKLSFLQSAAIMQDAVMNFVNDSAPMHLCSAVNAPVTAIFCSTVPEFGFGPLSDDSAIVQIDENLYCRPCGLHGYRICPEKHFRCAKDIDISHLLSRIPDI